MTYYGDTAHIRISKGNFDQMQESLLEEYCHILRMETPVPSTDDHDSIFWAILGQITMKYREE